MYTTLYNTLARKPTDNLKHLLLQSMEMDTFQKSLILFGLSMSLPFFLFRYNKMRLCLLLAVTLFSTSAFRLNEILDPSDSCTGLTPRPIDYSYFSEIHVAEKSGCSVEISVYYFNVATADTATNLRGYNFILLTKDGKHTSSSPWKVHFNETVPGTKRTSTPTAKFAWRPGAIKINDSAVTFRAMMIRKNYAGTSVAAGDSIPFNVTCAGPGTGTQGSFERAYDSFTAEYSAPIACATSLDWTLLLFLLFVGGGGSLLALLCGTTALRQYTRKGDNTSPGTIQLTIG